VRIFFARKELPSDAYILFRAATPQLHPNAPALRHPARDTHRQPHLCDFYFLAQTSLQTPALESTPAPLWLRHADAGAPPLSPLSPRVLGGVPRAESSGSLHTSGASPHGRIVPLSRLLSAPIDPGQVCPFPLLLPLRCAILHALWIIVSHKDGGVASATQFLSRVLLSFPP
jgi:hypothetical protein